MQFLQRSDGRPASLKTCQYADPFGNRCGNSGILAQYMLEYVENRLEEFERQLRDRTAAPTHSQSQSLKVLLESKRRELADLEAGYERLQEEWIRGKIRTRERYERLQSALERDIRDRQSEIVKLEEALQAASLSDEERLQRLKALRETWRTEVPNELKNRLARQIIDRIIYRRDGDTVHIEVRFL